MATSAHQASLEDTGLEEQTQGLVLQTEASSSEHNFHNETQHGQQHRHLRYEDDLQQQPQQQLEDLEDEDNQQQPEQNQADEAYDHNYHNEEQQGQQQGHLRYENDLQQQLHGQQQGGDPYHHQQQQEQQLQQQEQQLQQQEPDGEQQQQQQHQQDADDNAQNNIQQLNQQHGHLDGGDHQQQENQLDQQGQAGDADPPQPQDGAHPDNLDIPVEPRRHRSMGREDDWSQHDIQALLVKAINHKSPLKDLELCIKCGADVNLPLNGGLHPLHYAAYTDYIVCIKFLLDNGANVNATDDIGYTPLHLAARCGNYNTLLMLLENGAIVNFNEPGKIIRCTDEKNKLGYSTTEPINLAVQNNHKECVKLLLDYGARANNQYFMGSELCLAPLEEPACLEILLQHGADPNVFNRCGLSPLMRACKGKHIDSVRMLLKYGADVNLQCPPLFERKTALVFAIASENIAIINLLIGRKASLKRFPDYKYAALHCAVRKGRADIVRLLLQQGADVNEKTDEGASALMLACGTLNLRDREEIVKLLICCGADINAHAPTFSYSDLYLSPLTEYLKNIKYTEQFSIVEILIQNGATVNYCEGEKGLPVSKRINPFSILQYADCMVEDWKIFELTLMASTQFNPLAIHACETLPESMKHEILNYATQPRCLKHLVRLTLHNILYPDMPNKVQSLPVPALLKAYLLYQ